ncbi:hypothetical protein PYCCODRAFT_617738 [Trametes coccinea BRFM310]|uniref:Uncharacterized protein n=1 Tax=Trametes coccinea (strain BRFM310) TaxID=1353009 RepID=A0A1Y2J3W1_TRAC3|nr:hypothetical protein PYCCODRAFT_617738 [Trametes coccinea BRFM310]
MRSCEQLLCNALRVGLSNRLAQLTIIASTSTGRSPVPSCAAALLQASEQSARYYIYGRHTETAELGRFLGQANQPDKGLFCGLLGIDDANVAANALQRWDVLSVNEGETTVDSPPRPALENFDCTFQTCSPVPQLRNHLQIFNQRVPYEATGRLPHARAASLIFSP